MKYGKNWAYAIEIDDGPVSTATVVAPLLTNYSYSDAPPGVSGGATKPFVGGAAVYLARVEGNSTYISWSQLNTLKSSGWSVINHSYWHSSGTSAAEVNRELYWSQSLFAAIHGNGRAPTEFVYPNGSMTYKSALPSFGIQGGSVVDWPRNDTTSVSFDALDLSRLYMDEGAWTSRGGAAMDSFPLPPATGEIVIDFTHEVQAVGTANYTRWQQRLSTIANTYGKTGSDVMWCAPTGEIVDYVKAAKVAQVQVQSGKVSVTLPNGTVGTPLTVKLTGVSASSQITPPAGGTVYRQGTTVWVTSPMIGTAGATPPVKLKKVYDGVVSGTVPLGQTCKVACVRILQNGTVPGGFQQQINVVNSGGQRYSFASDVPTANYGVWTLYSPLPTGSAIEGSTVEVKTSASFQKMEVWALDESGTSNPSPTPSPTPTPTPNQPPVVNAGPDQTAGLPTGGGSSDVGGSLLNYNFDQGTGAATNSGSAGAANLTFVGGASWGANGSGVGAQTGDYSLSSTGANGSWAATSAAVAGVNNLTGFTITGWIKTGTSASTWLADKPIIRQQDNTWTGGGFILAPAASGNLRLNVGGNNSNSPMLSTGGHFDDVPGTWTFFAVTWDGSGTTTGKVKFYYGTKSSPAAPDSTVNRTFATTTGSGTSALYVAGYANEAWQSLAGSLDNLRVYGSVLTDTQVEQIRAATAVGAGGSSSGVAQAALNGTVTDDGLPTGGALTTTWSTVSGPAPVTFSSTSSASTTASFTQTGTYTLRLTANDSQASASDDVVVTVDQPAAAQAAALSSVTSRMSQGTAGSFDVNLATTGSPTVESRRNASGTYSVIFNFNQPISSASASLIGLGSISGTQVDGSKVTVNLSNVVDAQTMMINLTNVKPQGGGASGTASVTFKVLQADVSGNGVVNDEDVTLIKQKLRTPATTNAANAASDINATGDVNTTDVSVAKSRLNNSAL